MQRERVYRSSQKCERKTPGGRECGKESVIMRHGVPYCADCYMDEVFGLTRNTGFTRRKARLKYL